MIADSTLPHQAFGEDCCVDHSAPERPEHLVDVVRHVHDRDTPVGELAMHPENDVLELGARRPTTAGGWGHKRRETPDAPAAAGSYRRRMARQTYLVELYARAGILFERIQPAVGDAGGKETS
jgi:hypothetical protein